MKQLWLHHVILLLLIKTTISFGWVFCLVGESMMTTTVSIGRAARTTAAGVIPRADIRGGTKSTVMRCIVPTERLRATSYCKAFTGVQGRIFCGSSATPLAASPDADVGGSLEYILADGDDGLVASRAGKDPSSNLFHPPFVYHEDYSFEGWPEAHTFPVGLGYNNMFVGLPGHWSSSQFVVIRAADPKV